MATLSLYFIPIDHPYSNEERYSNEKWARIKIVLNDSGKDKTILDWQWDIIAVVNWFKLNSEKILNEKLNEFIKLTSTDLSLAQKVNLLFDKVETDDQHDILYIYKLGHDLHFAFNGADIPEIIIGKNALKYEISSIKDSNWKYEIDNMKEFLESINNFSFN